MTKVMNQLNRRSGVFQSETAPGQYLSVNQGVQIGETAGEFYLLAIDRD